MTDNHERACELYREELIEQFGRLQEALKECPLVATALTAEELERGRATIAGICPGNEVPSFPPLFLYVLKAPGRLELLENALQRAVPMMTGRQWKEFAKRLSDAPTGTIGELAVFSAALSNGLPVTWFPATSTGKVSDLALQVRDARVFIEVTALTQGEFWNNVDRMALASPDGMWAGSAPGPKAEAARVSLKVAEELAQVAPGEVNVLAIIFSGVSPSKISRGWGFLDALEGPDTVALPSGTVLDFSNRRHLDCVLEFEGASYRAAYLCPDTSTKSRLNDAQRGALVGALKRLPFWFPGSVSDG